MAVWKNSETMATDPLRVISVFVPVVDDIFWVQLCRWMEGWMDG